MPFLDTSTPIAYQQKLQKLAHYDPLTHLPNRRLLMEKLEKHVSGNDKDGDKFALLIIDLNNFKQVNDHYGHGIGEALLKFVAKQLQSLPRQFDIRGRLAGDEFLLTLELPGNDNVEHYRQILKQKLTGTIELKGRDIRYSCSIGVSLFPEHADNLESLLRFQIWLYI